MKDERLIILCLILNYDPECSGAKKKKFLVSFILLYVDVTEKGEDNKNPVNYVSWLLRICY